MRSTTGAGTAAGGTSKGTVVMGWLRTLVVCGAAMAMSGAGASAADMPGYPSLPMPLPSRDKTLQVDEMVSGWYLRGDVGYRFQRIGSASDPANAYTSNSIKNAFVGGGGAGYKFKWFRADLTGDYGWRSLYSGSTASGVNTVSAKIDTFTKEGYPWRIYPHSGMQIRPLGWDLKQEEKPIWILLVLTQDDGLKTVTVRKDWPPAERTMRFRVSELIAK